MPDCWVRNDATQGRRAFWLPKAAYGFGAAVAVAWVWVMPDGRWGAGLTGNGTSLRVTLDNPALSYDTEQEAKTAMEALVRLVV